MQGDRHWISHLGDLREKSNMEPKRASDPPKAFLTTALLLSIIDGKCPGEKTLELFGQDRKFHLFLKYLLESLTKENLEETNGLTGPQLEKIINSKLQKVNVRRTDQKLRWAFNLIIKILVERTSNNSKTPFMERYEYFLSKYAKDNEENLRSGIQNSKVSSLRRVKSLFDKFDLLKKAFVSIFHDSSLLQICKKRRLEKASEVIDTFILLADRNSPEQALKILKSDSPHRLPWSWSDTVASLELLKSLLGIVDSPTPEILRQSSTPLSVDSPRAFTPPQSTSIHESKQPNINSTEHNHILHIQGPICLLMAAVMQPAKYTPIPSTFNSQDN